MTGLDVGLMILVLAVVFCAVEYHEWRKRDEDRRMRRLRERGLA